MIKKINPVEQGELLSQKDLEKLIKDGENKKSENIGGDTSSDNDSIITDQRTG